jgi:hypothetical protein
MFVFLMLLMSRGCEVRVEDRLNLKVEWRRLDFNLDMEDAFYFLEFLVSSSGEPVTIQLDAEGVMSVFANAPSLVVSGAGGSVRVFEHGREYYMLRVKGNGEWSVEKDYSLECFVEDIVKTAMSEDDLAKARVERLRRGVEIAKDLLGRIEELKPEIERRMPRLSKDVIEALQDYIQETEETIERIEKSRG